ncbi:diguanylate cyclase [Pantoea sp. FN060301]|uniref:diguanylate cyclase n=1 Tax=Pantoea sp. FN060301 TaxID=3420380 RepID=UPI003D1697EF
MFRKISGFEIESDIKELNSAVSTHFEWANRLIATALFRDPADSKMTDSESHLHCHFSRWLNISLDLNDNQITGLDIIDATHARMHEAMRLLLGSIQSSEENRTGLEGYYTAQRAFLDAVDRYRSKLITLRNKHDSLTGLPLRQVMFTQFQKIKEHARLNGKRLYITLFDIDYFKKFNDRYGHISGDALLREMGSYLLFLASNKEKVYRFGGEEFIFIHEFENNEQFFSALFRIREGLQSHLFINLFDTVNITVTSGSCPVAAGETLQSLIEKADYTMSLGKEQGRGRALYNDHGLIKTVCK